MSHPFDSRPLTDPVDPHAVTAFARQVRGQRRITAGGVVGVIAIVIALIVAVPFAGLVISNIVRTGSPGAMLLPLLVMGIGFAAIGAIALVTWRRQRIVRYRLATFAQANHMTYVDRIDGPELPGMIFRLGSGRRAKQIVRGQSPRFVEFANYQYTTGSGKNSTTHNWGYVAVKLDVPLPNIVLDAVGNNSVFGTNLPASFTRSQRLSLEGDFDSHYTLYCPEGYERDALYLFTPDIMARFIDHAGELDVEIVDDWMFLYTRRPVSTLDPATWAWLFGVVGALITKFDQWARWRDERLIAVPDAATHSSAALPFAAPAGTLTPPPGVAQEGRRLRKSFSWVSVAAVIVFAIVAFFLR